ncbi:MAG: ABC transporter ATP-binding protein [Bacillota bacterium]|nr:ABC transporter ATP-binding protein [Bacillota bacterium]
MEKPLIELRRILKKYNEGKENELEILHGIDLNIYPGEFVAIVGESGSGKSTLMNIIGVLDHQTSGTYILDGEDVSTLGKDEMSAIRNKKIGFVFQNFNLIARMSALDNVELPMLYAGVSKKERIQKATDLLKMVGMEDRMDHEPNSLSGGQKQRVAIARALGNNPSILLADEPTGALDQETSFQVLKIFKQLNEQGKTIVIVTHSQEIAEACERIVTISDGRIVKDTRNECDIL